MFEYEAVLKRLAQLEASIADLDDDCILEVAVRAQSAVVTFNAKDFAGTERFGVRVIGPKELLARVRGPR